MAQNLILDLDNTLYGYDDPHKRAMATVLKTFADRFSVSEEQAQLSFEYGRKQTHLELPARAASHNRLLYFQKMLEYNNIKSMPHALEFYELYWNTFLDRMTLFDGVLDYLDKCQSNGSEVCILTDLTAHIQYRKIKKLDLHRYIDYLVTSEEAGIEKPHPYMFAKALKKLRCSPEKALMIGDSWAKDIVGANAMGIPSIWINHNREERLHLENIREVSRFEEINTHGK